MSHYRTGLAGSALAVIMLAAPGLAQEDPGAQITSLYQAYAEARTTLTQAIESGNDAQAAFDAAADARAELEAACQSAGAPDLAVCLDTYVAADIRIANDTQPLPELPAAESGGGAEAGAEAQQSAPEQEETAPEPSEEQQAEEQQADEQQTQQSQDQEPQAQESDAQEPAAEEPEAEEQQAEEQPAAQQSGETGSDGQQGEAATSPDSGAGEEAGAETEADAEAEAETESAPAEEDVQPESAGSEVQAAYTAYVEARERLETARAEDGDVVAAAREVNEALDAVVTACQEVGTPDLATCLGTYVSSDVRLENDLEPVTVPEPAEAEPGEESTDGQEAAGEEEQDSAQDTEQQESGEQSSEQDGSETDEGQQSGGQEPVEEALEEVPEEQRAPVLDSEKEQSAEGEAGTEGEADADAEGEAEASSEEQQADADQDEQQPSEPPQSDEEAQANVRSAPVEDATEEQGEEVSAEEVEQQRANRRRGPQDAEVVEQDEFRVVFQFNNQLVVQSQDRERLGYQAEDRSYQNLRNGRLREEIVRQDGTRVITIYNRNGDILHRRLIEPDGSEYVLAYTPPEYEDDILEWRDPAEDLPPLRLDIPADEYILDARAADQARIEEFLARPPVEQVQRYYSVDEVKRSARLRDMMRRLEVGDLTFATDSAALSQEQFGSLSLVAEAMLDLIERNPAETFLIEGHTDAVGDNAYNLALSDRRAETVAVVLTQTFGVPPQNLVTQGYGERYLRVRTQESERLNRRVTVKRITPLVSPTVASNAAG